MTPIITSLGPLTVSQLGFGTLSLSPLQTDLSVQQGAELLCYGWEKGIRFWDTAEIYENYPVLKAALKKLSQRPVIASKTYAYTAEDARLAIDAARRSLDLDYIDIFMLHEQTALTLPGHRPALDFMIQAKEKGIIKAIGVSTHSVECVNFVANMPEIDIIHPLYNKWGVGIHDGTAQDMNQAITQAHKNGKGIYAMKILGGGTLYKRAQEAIEHTLEQPWLDSAVIGMSSVAEIDYNIAMFTGREPNQAVKDLVGQRGRKLFIAQWCEGCGNCLSACGQGALALMDGQVTVDIEACILCGYCSRRCPDMCLKII